MPDAVKLTGEDLLYVVTEYADETLSQILPERPLSPREAREMLGPVLGALSYLHNRCLTHGHLRPTNIMVIDDQVKLSPDFGWRSRTRSIYDRAGNRHRICGPRRRYLVARHPSRRSPDPATARLGQIARR